MKKALLTIVFAVGTIITFAQTKEQMVGTYEMSVPDKSKTTVTLNADGSFQAVEQSFTNGKWTTSKTKKGRWAIEGDKLGTRPTEIIAANGTKSVCGEKENAQLGNCFKEDYLFATDRIWTINAAGVPVAIFVRMN